MGLTAKVIAEDYNLSLVQIHTALTFAYEQLEEIKQAIHDEEIFVEAFKKSYSSKIKHLPDESIE